MFNVTSNVQLSYLNTPVRSNALTNVHLRECKRPIDSGNKCISGNGFRVASR